MSPMTLWNTDTETLRTMQRDLNKRIDRNVDGRAAEPVAEPLRDAALATLILGARV